MFFVAAIG